MNRREAIGAMSEAGLLTERQAEAYVLREFSGYDRHELADWLQVSPSTADSHYATAKRKIEAARETVEAVEMLHGYQPEDGR